MMNLEQIKRNVLGAMTMTDITERGRRFMDLNPDAVKQAMQWYGLKSLPSTNKLVYYYNFRGENYHPKVETEQYIHPKDQPLSEAFFPDKVIDPNGTVYGPGITFKLVGLYLNPIQREVTIDLQTLGSHDLIERLATSTFVGHMGNGGVGIEMPRSEPETKSMSERLKLWLSVDEHNVAFLVRSYMTDGDILTLTCKQGPQFLPFLEFMYSQPKTFFGTRCLLNGSDKADIITLDVLRQPKDVYKDM